jgi:hypothetical protein
VRKLLAVAAAECVALTALALAGCATPSPRALPSAPAAGTLRLSVRDRVGWPLQLADLNVAIDGRSLAGAASPSIVAGVHTLVARARLRWPCALAGESATASITSAYALRVGLAGADLEVEVATRGSPSIAPEARPELRLRVSSDAAVSEWRSSAAFEAEAARVACARVAEGDAAICRVRVAAGGAETRRDVVDDLCKRDKLAQLEAYANILKESQARTPHGPFDDARERIARQRMLELEAEAWQCVGEELAFVPRVSVEHACAGELPDPWREP